MANRHLKYVLRKVYNHESLVGIDLRNLYLSFVDFSSLELRRADLDGCCLSHALLDGSDLTDANLTNAKLSQASRNRTKLAGTILKGAIGDGASFERSTVLA